MLLIGILQVFFFFKVVVWSLPKTTVEVLFARRTHEITSSKNPLRIYRGSLNIHLSIQSTKSSNNLASNLLMILKEIRLVSDLAMKLLRVSSNILNMSKVYFIESNKNIWNSILKDHTWICCLIFLNHGFTNNLLGIFLEVTQKNFL